MSLINQIRKDERQDIPFTEEDKTRLEEEVRRVMSYCQNISQCRRVQALRCIGEVFRAEDCHRSCDVCLDDSTVIVQDLTAEAIEVLKLVNSMFGNNTLTLAKEVFFGSQHKDIRQRGHNTLPGHSRGKGLGKKVLDQLFDQLLAMGALCEIPISNGRWFNNYLQVSSQGLLRA